MKMLFALLKRSQKIYIHLGPSSLYTCFGGPAWRRTCKQNSFCVGVVWQTQSIV